MKSGVSNFGIAMSYPMVERLRTSYQWLPEIKKINKIRYLPKSICGMERMTLLRAHEVPETEERVQTLDIGTYVINNFRDANAIDIQSVISAQSVDSK